MNKVRRFEFESRIVQITRFYVRKLMLIQLACVTGQTKAIVYKHVCPNKKYLRKYEGWWVY